MIFKTAAVYEMKEPDILGKVELAEHQQDVFSRFRPCMAQQEESIGFIPALPESEKLFYRYEDRVLMQVQIQTKILPTSVINKELSDRCKKILEDQERKVGSKERREIRDEIIFDLIPKAFTKDQFIPVMFTQDYLVIGASGKVADDIQSFIRQSMGSFAMAPMQGHQIMDRIKDNIITEDEPGCGFEFLGDYSLVADEMGSMTITGNLSTDDFAEHALNRDLKKILLLKGEIYFRLSGYNLTGIKYTDEIKNTMSYSQDYETVTEQAAATFIMASVEILGAINGLKELENYEG